MMLALSQSPPEVDVAQLEALTGVIRWSGVLASIVLVALSLLVLRLLDGLVERLSEGFAQWRMPLQKVRALVHFVVYLGGAVAVVLLSFHLSDAVLALLGGTAAVAIGFASKDLVSSLVGGILIIADRPFQVGDRVSFGGYYGDVTSIGLRSVRLQTLDDKRLPCRTTCSCPT
jgi:small-conductance mechanosensitive channel